MGQWRQGRDYAKRTHQLFHRIHPLIQAITPSLKSGCHRLPCRRGCDISAQCYVGYRGIFEIYVTFCRERASAPTPATTSAEDGPRRAGKAGRKDNKKRVAKRPVTADSLLLYFCSYLKRVSPDKPCFSRISRMRLSASTWIWRTRSRVRPISWPTSSSVLI